MPTKSRSTKPKEKPLVAATGLDYLGADGRMHRAEAGDTIHASAMDAKAAKWMTDGGFLAPPSDDSETEG